MTIYGHDLNATASFSTKKQIGRGKRQKIARRLVRHPRQKGATAVVVITRWVIGEIRNHFSEVFGAALLESFILFRRDLDAVKTIFIF